MNARIVFVFGLVFTLLNVVMAFTTHGGLFIMAGLGLIITLGSANYIWGAQVAMSKEEIAKLDWDESWSYEDMLTTSDEISQGYLGASDD